MQTVRIVDWFFSDSSESRDKSVQPESADTTKIKTIMGKNLMLMLLLKSDYFI